MQTSERQQTYLARAQEAEAYASQTTDAVLKDSWLGIAESYRDLADFDLPKGLDQMPLGDPVPAR